MNGPLASLTPDALDALEAAVARAVRAAIVETPPAPAALRKADAAAYLGISERLLEQLVAGGEIRPARVGRCVLFIRAQLDGFLASRIPSSRAR